MGDESFDGEMIEIGDPAEEPTAPESPPRVVIEYRERGVPWMLVPPLLVLSAVAAVLAYPRMVPSPTPRISVAKAAVPDIVDDEPEVPDHLPAGPNPPPASVAPAVPPAGPASPFEATMIDPPGLSPIPTAEAAPPPTPADPVEMPVEPATFPRVQGLGFDPRALEAGRDPEPPVDRALAPAAGQDGRRDEPARVPGPTMRPAGPEQPQEVDSDLLPPDPRMARIRRQRRVAEARQQAEAKRGQFHAELRAICRKLGPRSAPEIVKLYKRYDAEIDPAIKQKAGQLLGKAGSYEGASRAIRINLLRTLGFPEPAVLGDLMDNEARWESDVARGGLNSEESLYHAALLLLKYPPTRAATATRSVSTSRPEAGHRPSPLADPGPAR